MLEDSSYERNGVYDDIKEPEILKNDEDSLVENGTRLPTDSGGTI
jgi:hypothetical protein